MNKKEENQVMALKPNNIMPYEMLKYPTVPLTVPPEKL